MIYILYRYLHTSNYGTRHFRIVNKGNKQSINLMVHYLVAVDQSDCSARALQKAIAILNKQSDKLTCVHAIPLGDVCLINHSLNYTLNFILLVQSNLVKAAALVDPLTGDLSEAQEVDKTENEIYAAETKGKCELICKANNVCKRLHILQGEME